MKKFMDADFLLSTETAKTLFHSYAKQMPIIDYHCHINPKEISENRTFSNITQMWLEGDHYKWRIMRSNGIDEKYITGDATDKEKFLKFASALPRCIGNPMYHWCHLELRNYFGYEGELNESTAQEVWDHCSNVIAKSGISVRDLIKKSNVYFIGTTDDPTDTLEWHKKIADENIEGLKVAPSFRPDKITNIDKPIWLENIEKLADVVKKPLNTVEDVKAALTMRIDYFNMHGCRAADHGMDYVCCTIMADDEVEAIYQKALKKQAISVTEAEAFKTALYIHCATQYARLGWAFQIHYNALRNPNDIMYKNLGADFGFDVINTVNCTAQTAALLNVLNNKNALPKTIIYSLNPADNAAIGTVIGAFQGTEVRGKIQHGSAWWFNDNKTGMQEQLISLANLGILGNFIGMLTDSRSFLSYARHEYFRRILCEMIGNLIENGEYPSDLKRAGALVQDICFNNAKNYFNI